MWKSLYAIVNLNNFVYVKHVQFLVVLLLKFTKQNINYVHKHLHKIMH